MDSAISFRFSPTLRIRYRYRPGSQIPMCTLSKLLAVSFRWVYVSGYLAIDFSAAGITSLRNANVFHVTQHTISPWPASHSSVSTSQSSCGAYFSLSKSPTSAAYSWRDVMAFSLLKSPFRRISCRWCSFEKSSEELSPNPRPAAFDRLRFMSEEDTRSIVEPNNSFL